MKVTVFHASKNFMFSSFFRVTCGLEISKATLAKKRALPRNLVAARLTPRLALLICPLRDRAQPNQRTGFPLRQKEHVRILALAPSLVTKSQVSILSRRLALPRQSFPKNTRGWRLMLSLQYLHSGQVHYRPDLF